MTIKKSCLAVAALAIAAAMPVALKLVGIEIARQRHIERRTAPLFGLVG